tara:strand:- start:9917 stop:10618 length:702 start_codon:yes stop_codon:yes gene_type:complete
MNDRLTKLKEKVCKANLDLVKYDLVTLTWGNVSGVDRDEGLIAIKPSGVDYENLQPEHMVIVDLDGNVVDGNLRPSSDTPTHVRLYNAFEAIEGVAHSHSLFATMFCQACKEIPCFGTTHADHFHGKIPLARFLTPNEVEEDYEGNTGNVIIERFTKLNPIEMPGVLVSGHAPFAWGNSPSDAVNNLLILERVARMAIGTTQLDPKSNSIPDHISNKHYERKHGKNAYYGQEK